MAEGGQPCCLASEGARGCSDCDPLRGNAPLDTFNVRAGRWVDGSRLYPCKPGPMRRECRALVGFRRPKAFRRPIEILYTTTPRAMGLFRWIEEHIEAKTTTGKKTPQRGRSTCISPDHQAAWAPPQNEPGPPSLKPRPRAVRLVGSTAFFRRFAHSTAKRPGLSAMDGDPTWHGEAPRTHPGKLLFARILSIINQSKVQARRIKAVGRGYLATESWLGQFRAIQKEIAARGRSFGLEPTVSYVTGVDSPARWWNDSWR